MRASSQPGLWGSRRQCGLDAARHRALCIGASRTYSGLTRFLSGSGWASGGGSGWPSPTIYQRARAAEQCSQLAAIARAWVRSVWTYVKPLGALYHAANEDAGIARALVTGAIDALGDDLIILGPVSGLLASVAAKAKLGYLREGFADRATRADGTLVPRGEPGALVTDPALAAARARELIRNRAVDTLCVHGDTPGAVAIARAVRTAMDILSAC